MKNQALRRIAAPSCLALLAVLTGCAGVQQKQNLELDSALVVGSYSDAALIAERRMGLKPAATPEQLPPVVYQPKHVLSHLEAAEAWRMAGELDRAIEHYDAAESALGDTEANVAGKAAGKIGAALVNETLASYVPSPAESILINYYKALIFWANGKSDLARVELNRADDRTRRAVERYSKEIEEAQREAEKKKSDQTYSNPQVAGQIDSHFPEMSQWAPYAEFIVPPATYVQALYLGTSDVPSDREKSIELYERLTGIVGEHPALAADFADVRSQSLCPENDCLWVLVERGQGPELQERKFSYPAFTGRGVVNVSMALPALTTRFDPAMTGCAIHYASEALYCDAFASMDRVIQTEFSKRFPGIVTRAVVSTVVKAVAQDQITREAGLFGGLLAAVVTDAVTTADIRMWRSMPGEFTLNRLRRNGSTTMTIAVGDRAVEVPLADAGSQLIHVKAPLPHLDPVVTVIAM